MAKKEGSPTTTTTATATAKREHINIDAVTALILAVKAKSPENSRILSERLARYVDAKDEKNLALQSLKAAVKFIKG